MSDTYVILIDGNPYCKDSAIRTYKTRDRAKQEAQRIGRYWSYRDSALVVAKFSVVETELITVERQEYSACPYAPIPEVIAND
ncbi:hypothetical protein D3C81_1309460 [compost metagenome]